MNEQTNEPYFKEQLQLAGPKTLEKDKQEVTVSLAKETSMGTAVKVVVLQWYGVLTLKAEHNLSYRLPSFAFVLHKHFFLTFLALDRPTSVPC